MKDNLQINKSKIILFIIKFLILTALKQSEEQPGRIPEIFGNYLPKIFFICESNHSLCQQLVRRLLSLMRKTRPITLQAFSVAPIHLSAIKIVIYDLL